MYTFQLKSFIFIFFIFQILILTITSAANIRTQNHTNSSLISVFVVILYQWDMLFERNVNAVTIKPTLYLKMSVILM